MESTNSTADLCCLQGGIFTHQSPIVLGDKHMVSWQFFSPHPPASRFSDKPLSTECVKTSHVASKLHPQVIEYIIPTKKNLSMGLHIFLIIIQDAFHSYQKLILHFSNCGMLLHFLCLHCERIMYIRLKSQLY